MRRFVATPLFLLMAGAALAGQAPRRLDGDIQTLAQAAGRIAARLADQLPLIAESAAPVSLAYPRGSGEAAFARDLIVKDLAARGFTLAPDAAGGAGGRFLVETGPGEGRTRRLRIRSEPGGWVLAAEDFLELPPGWEPAEGGVIVQGSPRNSRKSALRDAEQRAVRLLQLAYGFTGPPERVLAAVPMDVRIDACVEGSERLHRAVLRIRGPAAAAQEGAAVSSAFSGWRAEAPRAPPNLLPWAFLTGGLAAFLFLTGKVLDFLTRGWHTRAVFTASAIIWLAVLGLSAALIR